MEQINFFDVGKNFESSVSETVFEKSDITETDEGGILVSQTKTTDINRDHELKILTTKESINQAIDILLQTSGDDVAYDEAQSPLANIPYDQPDEETANELSGILKSYIEINLNMLQVNSLVVEANYDNRYYKIYLEWSLLDSVNLSGDFTKFLTKS